MTRAVGRHAIVVTEGGAAAYRALIESSARWRTYVQSLPGKSSRGPRLVEDLFYALYQSEVDLNPRVDAELYRNFSIVAGLLPMSGFNRLRAETKGDPIAAATAARRLADGFLAAEGDEGEGKENSSSHPLAGLLSFAVGFRRRRRPGPGAMSGRERERGAEAGKALPRENASGIVSGAAVRALDNALAETMRDRQIRSVWGIEAGVRSVHALDDVWELVDAVRSLPGFDELTDAFEELGERLRPAGRAGSRRQRRRMERRRFAQLQGLTRGRDIERVVPEQFVRLLDPDTEGLFREAYEHGRLLQERYGAAPPDSPGPLVVCIDVSRSMNTLAAKGRERFVWAKGVGLALLKTARRVGRPFLGICFSSRENIEMFEMKAGEYDPRLAVEWARCDFDGGTHFQQPLLRAVEYLKTEQVERATGRSFGPGHIVFVTDGEAALPADFVNRFREARQRIGFRMFTIFIDGEQQELVDLSDRVFAVRGDRIRSWEQTASDLARAMVV